MRSHDRPAAGTLRPIRVATTALATAVLALAAAGSAEAHFKGPQLVPTVPGIGKATGILGPPPAIEVSGGRVWFWGRRTVHVLVRCWTSTEAGCSGQLELSNAAQRVVSSAGFELEEGQGASVFLKLPARARRLAGRPRGWRLRATARGIDSLGRSGRGEATLTVLRR